MILLPECQTINEKKEERRSNKCMVMKNGIHFCIVFRRKCKKNSTFFGGDDDDDEIERCNITFEALPYK